MNDDTRAHSLHEWNTLEREIAENAIVSSMLEAALKTSDSIDEFGTWLLVGTASIAAFYITNGDDFKKLFTDWGFWCCGVFLILSCVFGFLTKCCALLGKIGSNGRASVNEFLPAQLQKYNLKEAAILERAQALGIDVETGIRMDRVMEEFHAPLPKWIGWLPKRHIKKHGANPQVAYLMSVSYFLWQSVFLVLQALTFLGFLISGLYFVAVS